MGLLADTGNAKALASPVLPDATSASDVGIIIGAVLAAGAPGTFLLRRRISARIALGAGRVPVAPRQWWGRTRTATVVVARAG